MAYATHNQLRQSRFVPRQGQIVDTSLAGESSARNSYGANDPGIFEVHHRITTTQKDALITDYATQRETTFAFTWQETGETFSSVFYAQRPQAIQEGPDLWYVVSRLVKESTVGFVLLETGDNLLQETDDNLILEIV